MNNLLNEIQLVLALPDKHNKQQCLDLLERVEPAVKLLQKLLANAEAEVQNERDETKYVTDRLNAALGKK